MNKYNKLVAKILLEDNLSQAVASYKYADEMLKNAKEKKLDSINYWQDRKSHAVSRIKVLKSKGEELTPETYKKSDEILNSIKQKNNSLLKQKFTNPKLKKIGQYFLNELKDHTTVKAAITHTQHLIHEFAKPIKTTVKSFLTNPSEASKKLLSDSNKFFKKTGKSIVNSKELINNGIDNISLLKKKYQTKFTPEEKAALKNDPDNFYDNLTNKLTDEEIKDMKRSARICAKIGASFLLGSYLGHITHHTLDLGSAIMSGNTDLALDATTHIGAEHLKGALKEATILSSMVACDLLELEHSHHENVNNNTNKFAEVYFIMAPIMKLYYDNPKLQVAILQSLQEQIKKAI